MAYDNQETSGEPSLTRRPERKLRRLVVLTALPGITATAILLVQNTWTLQTKLTTLGLVCFTTVLFGLALTHRLRFWLGTLSNLVSSLREGDYSFRVRPANREDPMGELVLEINALADQLRGQRLDARETAGIFRNVMQEIPVCVMTFDPNGRLRFLNPMAERVIGRSQSELLDKSAADLRLAECLEGNSNKTLELTTGGVLGRWALRRSTVRQDGRPHQLIVLTDLSRTLREEERLAWQRIVRVIGHEVNNSLAPIQSIAGSLESLTSRREQNPDWERDLREGLSVIRTRSESLARFMQAYSKLARLPAPVFTRFPVNDWITRTVALETRIQVEVQAGPDIAISADRDQLDQLLINLVVNAVDAVQCIEGGGSSAPNGSVRITWNTDQEYLTVIVYDKGPGIGDGGNLFVPFFTTREGGSGIGLALCRQIAEGHNGSLSLRNRSDIPGAEAVLQLPLRTDQTT